MNEILKKRIEKVPYKKIHPYNMEVNDAYKGRRKRSHVTRWKHKHYREYCIRCGKLLKKK